MSLRPRRREPEHPVNARLQIVLVSTLVGAIQVLGYAPFGLWPLSLLVAVCWLWQVRKLSARAVLLPAYLFGLGLYLAGVSWVFVSVHTYGGAPAGVAAILVLVLAAYLAIFPMLALGLAWVVVAPGARRMLIALPAAWLLAQHLRDLIFGGFPWLSTGYQWVDLPGLDGLLAVVGVQGAGVLWWLVAGCGVMLLQRQWRVAAPLLVAVLLGAFLLPGASHWTQPDGEALEVALIQGNVAQQDKWQSQNLRPTLEMYTELTQAQSQADLVIWPEVAIPAAHASVQPWFEMWQRDALQREQTVLAGVITQQDQRAYNTVYALGEQPGRYVKQHLVPFGEYFPVPGWIRPVLDFLNLPFSDIRTDLAGDRYLRANDVPIAMSICFEDVFPAEFARSARGSGVLVNVTNDAWFAGSLAPEQHFQIARARAAETGRVLLRVANTGISAVIGPDGRALKTLDWGERGVLTSRVEPRAGWTPYMRLQDWPLTFLALLALTGLSVRRFVRISSSHPVVPKHN